MTPTEEAAVSAYAQLRGLVLERLADGGLDRDGDRHAIEGLVAEVVRAYDRDLRAGVAAGNPLSDVGDMIERVTRSVLGYGPLDALLMTDDGPIEVEVRGADVSWKDHLGRWHSSSEPTTEGELRAVIDRLLQPTGRALSEATPIVSTQVLGRRVRLTASIKPISDVLEASLRFYRLRSHGLDDLVALGTLTREAANFLWALMRSPRLGLLVSGRPQSGKTTMVNALLRAVPLPHKVCCCEDTRELHAPHPHISYRQTKPPSGLAGDDVVVTMRDLIALTLRSSPERIVVGEVRGEEAAALTRAGNAGTSLLCTVHANSAADALDALVTAALFGGDAMPAHVVRSTFARTIHVVVHLDTEDAELRGASNGDRPVRRQVTEVVAVSPLQGAEDRFTVIPIFHRPALGEPLERSLHPLPEALQGTLDEVLARYGATTAGILAGAELARP